MDPVFYLAIFLFFHFYGIPTVLFISKYTLFYKNQKISVDARCSLYFADLGLYVLSLVLKMFLVNIEKTLVNLIVLNFFLGILNLGVLMKNECIRLGRKLGQFLYIFMVEPDTYINSVTFLSILHCFV